MSAPKSVRERLAAEGAGRSLEDIRRELDGIDGELKKLFARRFALAREVAAEKLRMGTAEVFAPAREAEILERAGQGLSPEDGARVRAQFALAMRGSRSLQYLAFADAGRDGLPEQKEPVKKRRVLLQGAEGAYQQLAASALFPELPREYRGSFSEVFEDLDEESVGVLPLENTTAGVVGEVFDALYGFDVYLNGSIELPISHSLIGRGSLSEVDTVLAHPQALKQCAGYLRAHGWKGVPCTNNAVAAKMVAESDSARIAAICAESCADLYRLKVLDRGISDEKGNTTRFAVLGKRFERVPGTDRLALIFRTENRPGALEEILSAFSGYAINVLALHSRPIPDSPFEYLFYAEFSGRYDAPEVRALLAQLRAELPFVKILGTF